ncbi:somatostatin-1-like isoform X1 [Oncorhynchus keta]|uniref:somatostatin-1-like isoform X1 n=1 Tax=Oncorhynchus keta TaxID=8018 RepID=UPI00227CF436|nr:somatostatin-1-like isoform X1 [Oncorhynchus keta]
MQYTTMFHRVNQHTHSKNKIRARYHRCEIYGLSHNKKGRMFEPGINRDLSHILLLKMLDLMATAAGGNEVLPDLEEALGVRSEVVRQLPLNQRERKAGCRNFYWKTFTSC